MANGTLAVSQLEMLSQSGTGIVTITPPATNTNRAITLPDAAGAIVVSGTTPSLNGITFPATQVASANANTLDDYEEGTFTPSFESAGISAITYGSGRNGYYVKIGKMVTVVINIMTNAITVTNSSAVVTISGLPFSATGDTESNSTVNIAESARWTSNPPGSGIIVRTTSTITLYRANASYVTADDASQTTVADFSTVTGNKNITRLTATYFV